MQELTAGVLQDAGTHGGCLTRCRNCLPFAGPLVHLRYLGGFIMCYVCVFPHPHPTCFSLSCVFCA